MSDHDTEMHTPEPVKWCSVCPKNTPDGTFYIEERCWRHKQILEGAGDDLMGKRLGAEPDRVQTDTSTQRAWGAFLRRPR